MTTQAAAVFTSHSGMQEIKEVYKRNLLRAMLIATGMHLAVIGIYYGAGYLGEEEEPAATVRIMKYTDLGPPPSIMDNEVAPQVAVSVPVTKPSMGVPVPVPDAEVNPEQTIATQQELSDIQSPAVNTGEGDGGVTIEQDINIDEDPPDFVAVEVLPVPIKVITPEYPTIATRAAVEGTVWVKILVDKEGKAKKALIAKSDNEIFNENAIKAALGFVFSPAMMNNGPVAVWAVVPFHFKLNK